MFLGPFGVGYYRKVELTPEQVKELEGEAPEGDTGGARATRKEPIEIKFIRAVKS